MIHNLTSIVYIAEFTQWQCARAEKTRHDEEVNILCAEFRRAIRGFDTLGKAWVSVADREGCAAGHKAYAHQQAAMYMRMHDECKALYDTTRHEGVDGEQLDHTLVSASMMVYTGGLLISWPIYSPCVESYVISSKMQVRTMTPLRC